MLPVKSGRRDQMLLLMIQIWTLPEALLSKICISVLLMNLNLLNLFLRRDYHCTTSALNSKLSPWWCHAGHTLFYFISKKADRPLFCHTLSFYCFLFIHFFNHVEDPLALAGGQNRLLFTLVFFSGRVSTMNHLWGSQRWTCLWCWGACWRCGDTSPSSSHRRKDSPPSYQNKHIQKSQPRKTELNECHWDGITFKHPLSRFTTLTAKWFYLSSVLFTDLTHFTSSFSFASI